MLRHVLALGLAASACVLPMAGCAGDPSDDADDSLHIGDGNAPEDEMVSERQLNGSQLPDKTISLTFDDGPGDRTTELVDFLDGRGIKATFFINGKQVPGRQGALEKVVKGGHLLANHTQNHELLTRLGAARIVREVAETDRFIAAVQPNGPWVLRAPFGGWNGSVARAINGSEMKKYVGSVFWDEGGELTSNAAADWACWRDRISTERCGDLYIQEITRKRKGVVLMHDINGKTVDMVKTMIPKLVAAGFKFAALADVPSIQRALGTNAGGGGTPPVEGDRQCSSATLGRPVDENVCVQSASNQRWFRCVDGDWAASTGPSDSACTQRFPL
jgi:peptidoglycan/xylan/chitin deacetylase (PgdA/CDA1 family)